MEWLTGSAEIARVPAFSGFPFVSRKMVLLIMCDAIRRMLEGSRPVDQLMLVIEFLILLFILWEFAWKVWDWHKERGEKTEDENEMGARLATLSPEESSALAAFILHNDQPSQQTVLSRLEKLQLMGRNFTGYFIPKKHTRYLKRWAKEKSRKRISRAALE